MDFHRRVLAKILQLRSFLTGTFLSHRRVPSTAVGDGDRILIERYDRVGDAILTLEVLSWVVRPGIAVDFLASPYNYFVFERLRRRILGSVVVDNVFMLPPDLTAQWQGLRRIRVWDALKLFKGLILPLIIPLFERGYGDRYAASVFFTPVYMKLRNVLKQSSDIVYTLSLQQHCGFHYPYRKNTRLVFGDMFRMLGLEISPMDEWSYWDIFEVEQDAPDHSHIVFSLNATEHRVYSYRVLLEILRRLARRYDLLVLPKHSPSESMRLLEEHLKRDGIRVAPERDLFDQAKYPLSSDLYVGFDSGPFHLHHHGTNALFLSSRGAAFAWGPLVLREPYKCEMRDGVWQLWVGKSKKHTKAIFAPLGLRCVPCYETGCDSRPCTRPSVDILFRSIESVLTAIS